METFEKNFRERLKTFFVKRDNGEWEFLPEINIFVKCSSSRSVVKTFAEQYPNVYKEYLDMYFDQIHPY